MTAQIAIRPRVRAHVLEGPAGLWTVRDDLDRRGGLFNDRKAAFKFIRREFGENAEVILKRGR